MNPNKRRTLLMIEQTLNEEKLNKKIVEVKEALEVVELNTVEVEPTVSEVVEQVKSTKKKKEV